MIESTLMTIDCEGFSQFLLCTNVCHRNQQAWYYTHQIPTIDSIGRTTIFLFVCLFVLQGFGDVNSTHYGLILATYLRQEPSL